MIASLKELREAITEVVEYNWDDEERDFSECVPGDGDESSNGQNGHVFPVLRDLKEWLS